MSNDISRRRFLHSTAAASAMLAASQLANAQTKPATTAATEPATKPKRKREEPLVTTTQAAANSKLRVACIGVGGQGGHDMNLVAESGATIVAICDVDSKILDKAAERFPKAKKYKDFREMFQDADDFDAVSVGTPDHTHAVCAMAALKHGKHVYCEKPMTHDIYEARMLTEAARKAGVVTQMGNQMHSSEGSRRQVEYIRAGAIGDVKEVHIWTNRPIWPQGMTTRPEPTEVPSTLDWDLWLGPAPYRPYASNGTARGPYHQFSWRGWWDFGTGALGDMACHIMDTPYWALGLDNPTSVEAFSDNCTKEAAPTWSIIRYEFAENSVRPAVKVFWYDGGVLPGYNLVGGKKEVADEIFKMKDGGTLWIGEKGKLLAGYGDAPQWVGDAPKNFVEPPKTMPRVSEHHLQWVEACLGGAPTCSNFNYAGPLTEMVLLGNLAIRTGKKVEWDVKRMRATNLPEANQYVRRKYRKGWEL